VRVFGIIGILLASLTVVFLATWQFTQFDKRAGSNPKQSVEKATNVATQANLKAVTTKLNVYYVENGTYPDSLDKLGADSQDFSIFEYEFCNPDKAIIKLNSSSYTLTNGNAVAEDSGGC